MVTIRPMQQTATVCVMMILTYLSMHAGEPGVMKILLRDRTSSAVPITQPLTITVQPCASLMFRSAQRPTQTIDLTQLGSLLFTVCSATTDVSSPLGRPQSEQLDAWVAPNPMSGAAHVTVRSTEATAIDVSIVDMLGSTVHRFSQHDVPSTIWSGTWDGRDLSDRPLPAGMYVLVVTTPSHRTHSLIEVIR